MTKIFLDAKLSHPASESDSPELVTIALVDEAGEAFYAENKQINFKRIDKTTAKVILPHIKGGTYAMPVEEIGWRMLDWIDDRRGQNGVRIITDAPDADWPQLQYQLSMLLPRQLQGEVPTGVMQTLRFRAAVKDVLRNREDLHQGSALDCAQAYRLAYQRLQERLIHD